MKLCTATPIAPLILTLLLCCTHALYAQVSPSHFVYAQVANHTQCAKEGGYWYEGYCWKDYQEEGMPKSKVDSVVAADMKIIESAVITMEGHAYPLLEAIMIQEDEGVLFIALFKKKDSYRSVLFPIHHKHKLETGAELEVPAFYYRTNVFTEKRDHQPDLSGTAKITILDLDDEALKISAWLDGRVITLQSSGAIGGAGHSTLTVDDGKAYLSGVLGTVTYAQVKGLIQDHPEVKTLILTKVSGSVNDAVNMHTGRLLREHGFTTKVLADSDIASGGVDLFCAGSQRIVEQGAKIGVHSWCCVGEQDQYTAIDVPKKHPAHSYQLAYFRMALGPKLGADFYFYTLQAAPFDGIHYMSDAEIKKWQIATTFIPKGE